METCPLHVQPLLFMPQTTITSFCDHVYLLLAASRWFRLGNTIMSINKKKTVTIGVVSLVADIDQIALPMNYCTVQYSARVDGNLSASCAAIVVYAADDHFRVD
jgi:hypothetical protein